jgi:putative nucleotidyltransferase with HDIG domain
MVHCRFREMILSVEELPSLPSVVQKLMSALQKEEVTAQDLEHIVATDPAISSRILKVANSAFFGRSGRVKTLDQAIVLLGTKLVQALAVSVSILDILHYRQKVLDLPLETYWFHSFAVAWTVHRLTQTVSRGEEDPGVAFMAGLLHDLGKLLLWIYGYEEYRKVLTSLSTGDMEAVEAERRVLGTDHAEVGGELVRWWKLPKEIEVAVRDHHEEGSDLALTRLVKLADYAAHEAGYEDGLRSYGARQPPRLRSLEPLSPQGLETLIEGLRKQPGEIEEVARLLLGK